MTLDLNDVTLDRALQAIAEQADLELTYSRHLVPARKRVALQVRNITVAAALTEVLFDAGVDVSLTSTGQMALVSRVMPPTNALLAADSAVITGTVTAKATQSPIAGATVVLDPTRRSVTTGADGRYRLASVPAGAYTVRVRYIGYAPLAASVTVSAGEKVTADFALERSVHRLQEVVTTGTVIPTEVKALPTPITVVSADEIAARHPKTLGDVIRQAVPTAVVPEVATQPIQTPISVRGVASLATSQMKIFVDGVEASLFAVAPVDPASIERIEVVRGPQAATIYGADAAVGVIQIFTKRGEPGVTRPQVDAQAALGVAETPYAGHGGVLRQQYTASVRGSAGDMSYNFGGGYTRLADYVPTDEVSRQSTPSVYGGMHFATGMLTADLSARYYHNELPVVLNPLALSTGFTPLSRPQYLIQDWTNETYGARVTVSPTGWWRNQFSMGVDRLTLPMTQTRPRLTTPDDTLYVAGREDHRKISASYNGSVIGQLSTDITGSVTAGIDHYDSEVDVVSATRATDIPGTIAIGSYTSTSVTNTGYFTQAQVNVRDALFLTAGLRADENSTFGRDFGTAVSPRIGLSAVHQFGQATIKIRGSYGRAIKAPPPGLASESVTPSAIVLASPQLGPERQRGWDGGVDLFFADRASLSVTGYDQIADNLIVFLQVGSTPVPTYQFQNIGRVTNRGIEVEGTVTFGPAQLKAQYGYVRSRIDDLGPGVDPGTDLQVGDQPLGTPKHTAGATLALTPRRGTMVTAGITYFGSFRATDVLAEFRCFGGTGPCPESFETSGSLRDFIVDYPGFTKVNFSLFQSITRELEAFISVDNLTNNTAYPTSNLDVVIGRITMVGLRVATR